MESKSFISIFIDGKNMLALVGIFLAILFVPCSAKADSLPRVSIISKNNGNIFTEDSGVIKLRFNQTISVDSGKVVVSDEFGKNIFEIIVLKNVEHIDVPLHKKGYYSIKASINFSDGVKEEFQTTAGVVGDCIPESMRSSSRIGIWHVNGDLSLALAGGSRWTRKMLTLKDYKISAEGRIIPHSLKETLDKRFSWIGTLAFGLPPWLKGRPLFSKSSTLYAPQDWSQLEALVEQFARDILDFPAIFELYNEPEMNWRGSQSDLIKFQAVLARGIKTVYPGTKVIGPSLYSIRLPELKIMVNLGLFDYLDGLSMHGYVNGTPPEAEFQERVIQLEQFLQSIGKGSFPIYITEFGWGSGSSNENVWKFVDELTQARYISRAVSLLTAHDVTVSIVFALLYKTDGDDGKFSLLHDDLTPKPAYVAFANVTKWLAGVTNSRLIKISESSNMVLFEKDGGTNAVIWNVIDDSPVYFPSVGTKFEDMMGSPLSSDKKMTISPSPIFGRLLFGEKSNIIAGKSIKSKHGDILFVDFEELWLPWPLVSSQAGTIVVPDVTMSGKYIVFGKHCDRVEVFEVLVR